DASVEPSRSASSSLVSFSAAATIRAASALSLPYDTAPQRGRSASLSAASARSGTFVDSRIDTRTSLFFPPLNASCSLFDASSAGHPPAKPVPSFHSHALAVFASARIGFESATGALVAEEVDALVAGAPLEGELVGCVGGGEEAPQAIRDETRGPRIQFRG